MNRLSLSVCALSIATLACGGTPSDRDPDPGPDPDPSPHGWFVSSPPASGARVWLEAASDDGRRLVVYGAELGEVFGWSLHVRHDGAAAMLGTPSIAGALGDAMQAAQLAEPRETEARLAEVRRAPDRGGASLDGVTALATIDVVRADLDAAIDLDAVVVRRVDGTYVPVHVAGGTVATEVQP